MSQATIYKLLEKEAKPLCVSEIALKINQGKATVSRNLRCLERWGEVSVTMKKTPTVTGRRQIKYFKAK